jgi:hypothetical protein
MCPMTENRTVQFEWHVSMEGNDGNPGTAERPFRTIGRAKNEARKHSASMKGEFRIWIREGTYAQTEALTFQPEDSANGGCRIIYEAFPGESVVISGGILVQGWEAAKNEFGRNLFKASVRGLPYSRHLYVNGVAAPRPRSPEIKATAWNVAKDETTVFWNQLETVKTYQGILPVYEGYRSTNADLPGWRNPSDIEAVFDVGWTHSICPVESIEPDGEEGAIIRLRMPCFRDCQIKAGVQVGVPSYYENVFELMETPGEWYYDRSEQAIYYFAHDEDDLSGMEFTIPLAEQLLDIRGTLEAPVRGISFIGLEFCYTTFLQPWHTGHPEIQANLLKDSQDDLNAHSAYVKVPSAVVLHAATDIRFENCRFHRLGSGAVDIEFGSFGNALVGNEFYQIAGSGVQVGDFSFADAHPEDLREIVLDNCIENNYFHHIGTDFKGSVAVIAGYTEGTVIAHNEICEIAYSGISLGWGWGYADPGIERLSNFAPDYYPVFREPTVMKRNRVEYNHIHHVLRKLHDGGAIYTLSSQPDSAIIGNYVHDNGNEIGVVSVEDIVRHTYGFYEKYDHYAQIHGFPGGIYMDEASAWLEISGNIVHNVVVPIYYHEAIKGTFGTLSIYGNVTNIGPDSPRFPREQAAKAGLEEKYKYLLSRRESI